MHLIFVITIRLIAILEELFDENYRRTMIVILGNHTIIFQEYNYAVNF